MVNNTRNKSHQTKGPPFCRALYSSTAQGGEGDVLFSGGKLGRGRYFTPADRLDGEMRDRRRQHSLTMQEHKNSYAPQTIFCSHSIPSLVDIQSMAAPSLLPYHLYGERFAPVSLYRAELADGGRLI